VRVLIVDPQEDALFAFGAEAVEDRDGGVGGVGGDPFGPLAGGLPTGQLVVVDVESGGEAGVLPQHEVAHDRSAAPPAFAQRAGEGGDRGGEGGAIAENADLFGVATGEQAAHRGQCEGGGCVGPFEDLALGRQGVEVRREVEVASVAAEAIGAQGVDADEEQDPGCDGAVSAPGEREQEQEAQEQAPRSRQVSRFRHLGAKKLAFPAMELRGP
jgi:hypothetical protein